MRVAFLVSHFPIVSETFILDQITGLIDRGCEVEIFADTPVAPGALHPEIEAYGLGGRTHVLDLSRNYVSRAFRAFGVAAAHWPELQLHHFQSLNFLRYGASAASLRLFFETAACAGRRPYDVIHCHFGPNGLRGLNLREVGALSGKLITSFYGYDVSRFLRPGDRNPYRKLFANSERVLAISQIMHEKLIALGCPPTRVSVHRLGVNPLLFAAPKPARGESPVRILTIGRMVPKKGLEHALRAVAAVASEVPAMEYAIIGDGPLRPRIEQTIDELQLRGVVRLEGWKTRPQVVEALSRADILLAPSVTAENGDQEGTPVVIMEALASGVPVVSTRHAGIPELVQDGVSGLLAVEGDVPALAGALRRLIGNPELRTRMGESGQAAIRDRHDISKLNDRLLEIYRSL